MFDPLRSGPASRKIVASPNGDLAYACNVVALRAGQSTLETRFEKRAPTELKNISVAMDLFWIVLRWADKSEVIGTGSLRFPAKQDEVSLCGRQRGAPSPLRRHVDHTKMDAESDRADFTRSFL